MNKPIATGLLLAVAAITICINNHLAHGDAASDAAAVEAAASRSGLHLESGVVLADGGTIHILGVPLVYDGGKVAQRLDITLHLAGEPGGTLRVDQLQAAPTILSLRPAEQFTPGAYVGSDGTKFALRGPAVSVGGRTSWAFTFTAMAKEDAKPITFDASWTTGTATGNPDIANQADLKTLPDGFAYGTVTYNGIFLGFNVNYANLTNGTAVLGARQIGDSIQIALFNHNGTSWTQLQSMIYTPQH